ncbi:MAG: hypothetical protein KJ709_04165 [Nanoarchaeota archaeon]|nr:hypothetical protein [Nanoarchaeota archaeon]
MDKLTHIGEGLRIFSRRLKVARQGLPRYEGDAKSICQQIVERCWNGSFFMTSAGHFSEFWTRDFGLCTDALLELGHKDRVRASLEYALEIFSRQGRITTTISPSGRAFDFPCYAPDSLAFLLRSLKALGDDDLVGKHKEFLQGEVNKFCSLVLDKKGRVSVDRSFSSISDHWRLRASCYDTCMTGMIKERCEDLGLEFSRDTDYTKLLHDRYWTGKHFISDLKYRKLTGEANVFPAWCGLSDKPTVRVIKEEGLDRPLPLRYFKDKGPGQNIYSLLTPGYESSDNIWLHLGMAYLNIVPDALLKGYIGILTGFIEHHKNFLEVVDEKLEPYRSLLYMSDDSMLWAANYLKSIGRLS